MMHKEKIKDLEARLREVEGKIKSSEGKAKESLEESFKKSEQKVKELEGPGYGPGEEDTGQKVMLDNHAARPGSSQGGRCRI